MKRNLLLAEFARTHWALEQSTFAALSGVMNRWSNGISPDANTLEKIRADQGVRAARRGASAQVAGGGIAVLNIFGVIVPRGNLIDDVSGPGACSLETVTSQFRAAMADPVVSQLLLNFDSPGGSVAGVPELADEIFKARAKKPIVGISNSLCASAAYWLASQCGQMFCTTSGEIGSIGVYTQHVDESVALEKSGLNVSFVSAGRYKTEGSSIEPLTVEARAAIQKTIDGFYSLFTQAVARGRGVSVSQVRDGMGQGRCLMAADGLSQKMVDGVATFDEVISRMRSKTIGQLSTGSRLASAKAALALAYPPKTANRNQLALQLMKA